MSARIFVDGWAESSYVYTLFDSSSEPVVLGADDFEISFSEVVTVFSCVLHDGGLTLSRTSKGGGEMFVNSRAEGAGGFTNVAAGARGTVGTGTGAGVDDTCLFRWWQLVFWFDQLFANGTSGANRR